MVERSKRCVVDVVRVIAPLSQSRWGGAGLAQVRCAVNRQGLVRRKNWSARVRGAAAYRALSAGPGLRPGWWRRATGEAWGLDDNPCGVESKLNGSDSDVSCEY